MALSEKKATLCSVEGTSYFFQGRTKVQRHRKVFVKYVRYEIYKMNVVLLFISVFKQFVNDTITINRSFKKLEISFSQYRKRTFLCIIHHFIWTRLMLIVYLIAAVVFTIIETRRIV